MTLVGRTDWFAEMSVPVNTTDVNSARLIPAQAGSARSHA